jgi:hypothetical protein
MPWTPRQVRYLESSGSPLTAAQKAKMNSELHADPSLGHHQKGSTAMQKNAGHMKRMEIEIHHGASDGTKMPKVTGFTVHHHMMPKAASKSGAFMERETHSHPFSAAEHGAMMSHVADHLGGLMGKGGNGKGDNAAMDGAGKAEAGDMEAAE